MANMTHTITEIRAEYDRLDVLCGVDTSDVKLKISKRGIHRYGYCKYSRRADGVLYPTSISIADFLLGCDAQFWDTVRHEYAHAVAAIRSKSTRSHGHDQVWKNICREIGCKPERVANDAEARKLSSTRRKARIKYLVTCTACNRRWEYVKAGPVVQSLRSRRKCTCPCGSHALVLKELS